MTRHRYSSFAQTRLACCLAASLLPFFAVAADATTTAVAASAAEASASSAPVEARIPFANRRGGIVNWQVVDDSTLLIEGQRRQWYLVKLQSPAWGLYRAETLGFDTSPSGDLDNHSAIIFKGVHYPIVSVTLTDAPGKKKPQN